MRRLLLTPALATLVAACSGGDGQAARCAWAHGGWKKKRRGKAAPLPRTC